MKPDSKPTAQQTAARARRWGLAGTAVAALALMGFYGVTDAAHLTHDGLLAGSDWLGYAVCHRLTEHSLSIAGRQLPLCARCTGMYLGVSVALLFFGLKGRMRHVELPPLPILLLLLGFIGVMGVDGVNSMLHFFPDAPHLYAPRNWLRLLTGVGTGLAMGSFVFPALAQTLWRQVVPQPMLANGRELLALLGTAGLAALLALSNQPALLYVLAIVSTVGLVLTLGSLNIIMSLILLRRDGKMARWRETAVVLSIGMICAILQLSAISLIRYNLTGTMTGLPGLG